GSEITLARNLNRRAEVPGGVDSSATGCLATLLPAEKNLRSLSGSGRGGASDQTACSRNHAKATANSTTNSTPSLAQSDVCHAAFCAVRCCVSPYDDSSMDRRSWRWIPHSVQ